MRQPVPFGKYLLLDRISVGGMAEVFKAKSYGVEGFEKIIAIKRILPTMGEDRDFIKMFIDEAKIAGQLAHANICQIFELGRIDGSHFIAMEYIWGKDLLQIQNRLRKTKQPMPVPMACFSIAKVLEGLDYAHRKRDAHGRPLEIVHRDCSPQNVLVSYEGEVKIIDFGIAKATSRNSRTMAGVLKGKFGYMSPEQVRGLPLDRRSDIFALGTMLYECLTGERLFMGETDFSTLEKVRNVDILPPRAVNPAIPESVERVILKALAKDVDDRYQWCSEMLADLQQYLMGQDVVFTAKSLSGWLKDIFAQEIDRERSQLEQYKRVGRDGLIGGLPSAEADSDIESQLGATPLPEGDATTLGGPNFDDIIAEAVANAAGRAQTSPDAVEGQTNDFGEEVPTEIFGDRDKPPPPAPQPPPRAQSQTPSQPSQPPRPPPRAPTARPSGEMGAAASAASASGGMRPQTNTPAQAMQPAQMQPQQMQPQPQPQMQQQPYGQPPTGVPQQYPVNPAYGYGQPALGSDPGAGMANGFPVNAPQTPAPHAKTVLGMQAPPIPTQVPPGYPGFQGTGPQPISGGQMNQMGAPMGGQMNGQMGAPMGNPMGPMNGQMGNPMLGNASGPMAAMQGGGSGQMQGMPQQASGPYPQMQPGQQGGYPQYPQQQSPYPQAQQPYGMQQQPYGYSGVAAMPQPPVETVARPEGKKSTLVRDIAIGVAIAAVVLGGFFIVKFVILDSGETPAPKAVTTVKLAMTPGVSADMLIDGKKVATVADKQEVPVSAGPHQVELIGPGGTKCDQQVTLEADKTTTLKCDMAPAAVGSAGSAAAAGSADSGSAAPLVGSAAPMAGSAATGSAATPATTAAGSGAGSAAPMTGSAAVATVTPPATTTPPPTTTPTPPVTTTPPPTVPTPPATIKPATVTTTPATTPAHPAVTTTTGTKPATTPSTPPLPPNTTTTVVPAAAAGKGFLTVQCNPKAKIIVDGVDTGMSTPISGHALSLAPGKHKITFVLDDDRYTFPVTITAGQTATLVKDLQD